MIEALRRVAGTDAVREAAPADEVHGVRPRAVVTPDSADALAAALAQCSERGWTVEVAGGRSSGPAGRPVDAIDVLLSTRRLNGIAEYEPDDLTIGVRAGTTLAELGAAVAPNRQRVPLDALDANATVGGVLARAAAGPMRQSWSTPRRHTLGLELVTGDGRILRVGGRVVKNVAGYDMNKLIIGSAGTLGVITRAHLRLLPVPDTAATFAVDATDVSALLALARELITAPLEPAALELAGPQWRLVVRYEGTTEVVAGANEHLDAVTRAAGLRAVRDDDALARLARTEGEAAIAVRLADLPSRLDATIEAARGIASERDAIAAHVGYGVVRVLTRPGEAEKEAPLFARAIETARLAGTRTVVVERAPATLMRALDPWGPIPEAVMRITRELKRQFDPARILQRGRWIA